jgi:hypothetical protein
LAGLIISPVLGKKIATDEEFRSKYVPKWFNYTVEQPKSTYTREEMHEQIVQLQSDLHERAIRGEFTPENLKAMRRQLLNFNAEPNDKGWDNLNPGDENDEDLDD